ncbi:maltose alpha-D-glucosyltransferase/ alpha-amylase [Catalinimonas alkaloidigena]|uniref:Maltose alpha-D-glucosyltransferase/ alpha-amylase n=1 Tax=Catalinimonas alkaloidigena TaxID=1075417 RepID=A0A1G9RA89_9BACT|nr:alpha-amylase family protein [Catalinimonas alkaloidigena]SDM20229.1 maltose alpha-D-glucosyltransferase/ alpha-amylase [Catalinimonas alkaloidigena]
MIEDLWYKNSIIYSLDLETFMDANGDGVGDFEGLMQRLDYLDSLGVDTIWLAPFQPTPNRDNGYDISDYYGVDPRHGSSGAFVEFMHQAHKRGIKVIIDLVVNHTSDQHPWFQEARNPQSPYHDWYVWQEKRPSDWNEGMVFPGVQESTWTYDKKAKQYYFHRFYDFQPDLNMENTDVRAEVQRIMGYWLQLGVAGFRVDAVPFILETPAPGQKKPQLRFEYLAELRRFLQWRRGDAILLGEANVMPEETKNYFGEHGEGIHMMFNFYVNQYLFYALATADVAPLADALRATQALFPTAQWAQFLRNHDELDLGRLTEEQRQRVFERFGPDPTMQLYERGIRRRLSPMIGNRPQSELAYSLLFSLPGTPVIRYGDEIGMGDDLSLKERDAVRTPMQWSDDRQAGFSVADHTIHPLIDQGPYRYARINVEAQQRDKDSLLGWMTRMIRLRKQCPEIGWGEWQLLDTKVPTVLAMRYEWRGNALLLLHNFDQRAREVRLTLPDETGETLVNLLEEETCTAEADGAHLIILEGYGYRWFRIGDLRHVLRRSTH